MKILVTIGLLCFTLWASGQDKPKIETISVSVNSTTQEITIKWKPFPDLTQINWYAIYEFSYKVGHSGANPDKLIDIIANTINEYTFTYPDVMFREVPLVVLAQAGEKVVPPTGIEYNYKNISSTISLYNRVTYDKCLSNITLKWNRYMGWGATSPFYGNVKEYQVINQLTGEIIGATTDTTYTLNNVTPNTQYQFKVRAIQEADPDITSLSNSASVFTLTEQPPAFINAQSASYINGKVDIKFEFDGTSVLKNYILTRSQSPSGEFLKIAEYNNQLGNTLTATDNTPLPVNGYYRLESLNLCGLPTTVSNLATAIVPRAIQYGDIVEISWDPYIGWNVGVERYDVYRKVGQGNTTFLQTVAASNNPSITDKIDILAGQNTEGVLCYYVVAFSANIDQFQSISQDICIELNSDAVIPNAFTPDGNGKNDEFKPTFTFLPQNFEMYIYDRYGYKVFETKELKGWNGLLKNGKKAPEGTYLYFIYFTSATGKKIEKRGSVTLFYP